MPRQKMTKATAKKIIRGTAKMDARYFRPLKVRPDIPADHTLMTITLPVELADRLALMANERGTTVSDLVRVAMHSLSRRATFYHLDTPMGFGKYANEPVEAIIRCDPRYVRWCVGSVPQFVLSDKCIALLEQIDGLRPQEPLSA